MLFPQGEFIVKICLMFTEGDLLIIEVLFILLLRDYSCWIQGYEAICLI